DSAHADADEGALHAPLFLLREPSVHAQQLVGPEVGRRPVVLDEGVGQDGGDRRRGGERRRRGAGFGHGGRRGRRRFGGGGRGRRRGRWARPAGLVGRYDVHGEGYTGSS